MEVLYTIATMVEASEAAKYSTMGESHSQQMIMQYWMRRDVEEAKIKREEISGLWHLKVGNDSCLSEWLPGLSGLSVKIYLLLAMAEK